MATGQPGMLRPLLSVRPVLRDLLIALVLVLALAALGAWVLLVFM